MTSAFHRPPSLPINLPPDLPPFVGPVYHRRVRWRVHPAMNYVFQRLKGTPFETEFTERAVKVSTYKVLTEPIEHESALLAHRWILGRAQGEGLPLTAAGYLKPADTTALASLMPTMGDWPFSIPRESNVYDVLFFRQYLMKIGLLRKFKGKLLLTKAGREPLNDTQALWKYIGDRLLLNKSDFEADASVIILIHMATTADRIDSDVIAQTLTALGWGFQDGSDVNSEDVDPIHHELWTALGNVGDRVAKANYNRTLSAAASLLINEALFEEVDPDLPNFGSVFSAT